MLLYPYCVILLLTFDVKFKTSVTKDGWSEKVIDKKDNIQIKIGGVK
jgi:hypothetical protein